MGTSTIKITKEVIGDELYLYFNGKLVYKRWINKEYGRMFYENEGLTNKCK